MWYRHEEDFWNCDQNFTFANHQTAYGKKKKKLEWMYSDIHVHGASNLLTDTQTTCLVPSHGGRDKLL